MVDPSHTQFISEALAAPDPSMWCNEHRAQIDEEFVRAARQQLDEALRSDAQQAPSLGDLGIAAATVVENPLLLDLFTRLCEDLQRSHGELNVGDFSHSQVVFE